MSAKLLYVHHYVGSMFANKSTWSVIIQGALQKDFPALIKTDVIIKLMEDNDDLNLMFRNAEARIAFFSRAPNHQKKYLNFLNEQKRILLEN